MKNQIACAKCGSTDVIPGVKPIDLGDEVMKLARYQKPDALLFRGKQSSKISARVRSRCGFVEFYADNPTAFSLAVEDEYQARL